MTEPERPRHRFVLPAEALRVDTVHFPASTARQLRRVLRSRVGDLVAVLDGSGIEHWVRLSRLTDLEASGTVEGSHRPLTEPRTHITLLQALLPRERFELVLQKGTEVGISRFVPLVTDRSLVRDEAPASSRLERWRRIITEATEQSRRTIPPQLASPLGLGEALEAPAFGPCWMAWERESRRSIRQALRCAGQRFDRLTLLVGPEGGFTAAEVELARAAGALTVSAGPRILRAETAGPLLAGICLYELGDLEPG